MSEIELPTELPPVKPSLEDVLKSICAAMGVQQYAVKSGARKREIAAARQSYMAISRALFLNDGTTIEDIARLVNKHHSTVIHACKIFYQGYEKDSLVVSTLNTIISKCTDLHVVTTAKRILNGDFTCEYTSGAKIRLLTSSEAVSTSYETRSTFITK